MINLTEEQKQILGIKDERVDFYFKVENAVIDNPDVFSNIYESHLFVVLSRYCNNGGVAFPSYSTLAKLCYCSKSTVIRCIKSLEEKKLINKVIRTKKINDKKVNDTNVYTVNNLKKYIVEDNFKEIKKDKEVVSEKYQGGVTDTLGVVSQVHQGSVCGTPKKELLIKNNIKKNTTTKKGNDEEKISSRYEFLDLENFSKINNITKKNIRKNILNLTEEKAKEIYKLTEEFLAKGKGKSFDAIFYNGLLGEWNFESNKTALKSEIRETELSEDKIKWLNYFSGILSNKELYSDIKNIITSIPLETLKVNKNKLSRMTIFEFKQHLYSLKNC